MYRAMGVENSRYDERSQRKGSHVTMGVLILILILILYQDINYLFN